jgi:CHAT domain-containing protein
VLMDSPPSHNEDFSVVVAGASSSQEKSETTEIANAVGPERVTTISGKQTPIAGLEEQMRGKAVMHITSKFPLSDTNPLRSVLPFAGDSADGGKTVTADKLFGSSLPSDLIVWSASSINAKDVRGNAVKIFSRGLSYAGARNVLMTLWSQPDSQKVDELVHFYQSKQAGLNPAQSLRKAQMAALSRDPSPKSWAGFQLLGPGY